MQKDDVALIAAGELHIEAIRRIHEEARLRAKPHVDALVRLRSAMPPPPLILTGEEVERLGLAVRNHLTENRDDQ